MPAGLPALGERFADRFDLQALLIHSALGPAFRVHDLDVDEVVALLVLDDAGAVEQLRHQVRLARRVTHRNIARTYDMGEHEGRYFVTLEHIEGLRLRAWLATGPSLASIVDVAAQLAEGLAAAHEADVIHCDLTPVSVMIERGGRAVLGNFGMARHDLQGASLEAAETLMQVSYLAPEQLLGQAPVSSAVDVYALGLMVVEMSTTIPPALAQLLGRCTALEPSERISAAALAVGLREAQRSLTGAGEHAGPESTLGLTSVSQRHDSLAVLPFRYRGPRASDYLGEALFDELVDLLSQTRGLRVFASGATAGFIEVGDRDPKQIGERLGVDVIVDGTILLSGDRLRISARVIEVASGFQLWGERFEGSVADVFELQDKLAKRIAEALRVELEVITHRGVTDAAAVESYLRGRQAHLRWRTHGPDGAITHYRAALERAPEFKPALAHLAVASVLAWFQPGSDHAEQTNLEREAELAVERAMSLAAELPATRLAAANFAVHRGEFRAAALHLTEALRVAPTFALAHEYLGRLLLETGWTTRATEHLELAIELDPLLSYCLADMARSRALRGDLEGFRALIRRLVALVDNHRPSTASVHMRVGAWINDRALIRAGIEFASANNPRTAGLRRFGQLLLDPAEDMAAEYDRTRELGGTNPRMNTLLEQLMAESAAYHGDPERALEHLVAASELRLVDLEWLERCPLFEPLRERPEYADARAQVAERCEQIWLVVGGK